MEYGDKKRMNKMYGNRVNAVRGGLYARKKMKHGGPHMKGSQPMYSEAMPKAKAN